MASEGPSAGNAGKQRELYDWDFTTPEGRSVKAMLESEIAKAMQERLSGDLAGAVTRLERGLSYARSVRETQQKRVTADAEDEKDRLYQLAHAEELEGVLAKLVQEFKQQ